MHVTDIYYEYTGNMHLHSTWSDGKKTIPEIAEIADKEGLDYIIVTDHNTTAGLENGDERYYGSCLAIVAQEVNSKINHYLVFGTGEKIEQNTENPQMVIDSVNEKGGFGLLAHPFDKGSPIVSKGTSYPWKDWGVKDFQGISVWNFASQWRDAIVSKRSIMYQQFVNRNAPAKGPSRDAMNKIDEIGQKRHIILMGGTDAHGYFYKMGFFTIYILPYKFLFRTINMHILTKEPLKKDVEYDKELLYSSFRKGNCFIGFDYYKSSRGFRSFARSRGSQFPMGSEIELSDDIEIDFVLPVKAWISVFHNGNLIKKEHAEKLTIKADKKGVYRAEIFLRRRPWIFTNPFFIR